MTSYDELLKAAKDAAEVCELTPELLLVLAREYSYELPDIIVAWSGDPVLHNAEAIAAADAALARGGMRLKVDDDGDLVTAWLDR
jgi:hypothetical protein